MATFNSCIYLYYSMFFGYYIEIHIYITKISIAELFYLEEHHSQYKYQKPCI